MKTAEQTNKEFYEALLPAKEDYWRRMAAPRHRVDVLLSELGKHEFDTLADLGCGNGRMLEEIDRRFPGRTLHGIDLSQPQIEKNSMARPDISWHVANLDGSHAFEDHLVEAFDAVVAMEIIEHLDHPLEFLRSAWSLAAPNGRLFLSTQSGTLRETERRVGHIRHFSTSQIEEVLNDSGWTPIKVWNTGFPFHDLSKWYANRNPDKSMKRFGEEAYGWTEKCICTALRLAFKFNSRRRGAQLFGIAQKSSG